MSQICPNCGAVLADGERMCMNCGKVLPKKVKAVVKEENQFSAINQGMYQNTQLTDVKRQFQPTMAASNQTYSKERNRSVKSTTERNKKTKRISHAAFNINLDDKTFDAQAKALRPTEVETGSGNKSKSKLHPVANKIGWTITLLVFLYFLIGGIVILIVRNSSYDFEDDPESPIVAYSYAEAMYNYFDSGWWHFRFTKGVTFTGEKDGDKYELHFTKINGKRVVDEIYINGKKVDNPNPMKHYVRDMFAAEQKP